MKNKHIILENGLNIYLCPDKTKHTTYVSLIFKYGSNHNRFKVNDKEYLIPDGMAHFIEHYLLEHGKYGNLFRLLGEKQMYRDGYTNPIRTKYYFSTTHDLEWGLEKLITGINEPIFKEKFIEKTKEPIYHEIRMVKDKKIRMLIETSIKNAFHNYKRISNIGTLSSIKSFDYDTVKLCYDVFYQFKNQILIVAGNFNEEKVLKKIKEIYAEIKKEDIPFELITVNEPSEVKKAYEEYYMPIGKPLVGISFKINIKNYNASELLKLDNYLHCFKSLNFGITSPLYQELLEQNIIDYPTGLFIDYYHDYLLMTVINDTHEIEKFIKTIKEMFKTRNFNNNKEFFDLMKKEAIINFSFRPESLASMIDPFVDNLTRFNYPEFDKLADIESDNFEKYIKIIENLDFSHYTVTVIKDKN